MFNNKIEFHIFLPLCSPFLDAQSQQTPHGLPRSINEYSNGIFVRLQLTALSIWAWDIAWVACAGFDGVLASPEEIQAHTHGIISKRGRVEQMLFEGIFNY